MIIVSAGYHLNLASGLCIEIENFYLLRLFYFLVAFSKVGLVTLHQNQSFFLFSNKKIVKNFDTIVI